MNRQIKQWSPVSLGRKHWIGPLRLLTGHICPLQVYIVAVERSRQQQEAPDGTAELANEEVGTELDGAGLLRLVQSDLLKLSGLWLAALQDYAVLTLPQEYSTKLPASGEWRAVPLLVCLFPHHVRD